MFTDKRVPKNSRPVPFNLGSFKLDLLSLKIRLAFIFGLGATVIAPFMMREITAVILANLRSQIAAGKAGSS